LIDTDIQKLCAVMQL